MQNTTHNEALNENSFKQLQDCAAVRVSAASLSTAPAAPEIEPAPSTAASAVLEVQPPSAVPVVPVFASPAEGAKFMAALGLSITPLRGKAPFLSKWQEKASTDPEQIDAWVQQYGADINFGCVAKAVEGGFFIFEVDSPEVAKRYKQDTGKEFTETFTVRSRAGRGHRYYRATAASIAVGNVGQNAVPCEDFSVRMNNEQCVAPGSIHPTSRLPYRIAQNLPIVEADPEMLAWFIEQKRLKPLIPTAATNASGPADKPLTEYVPPPDEIGEGGRNDAVSHYVWDVMQNDPRGKDETMLRALAHEYNQEHCRPPLDSDEVDKIVTGKRDKRITGANAVFIGGATASEAPHVESAEERKERLETEFAARQVENVLKMAEIEKIAAQEAAERAAALPGTLATPVAATEIRPFVWSDGDEFMKKNIPPRKVLLRTIKRGGAVYTEQSINQTFAWRGGGKTCLEFGKVRALATGGKFLNWEAPERVRVLYIEGEIPDGQMQERWKQIVGETDGYARLITIDQQPEHSFPSFAAEEGMRRVEKTLTDMEADGWKPDVLFLDSISTLFNVAANDEEIWMIINPWLMSLRSRGLMVEYAHHAGKAGLSRSHSKQEDPLDVSIKLDTPQEKDPECLHFTLHYDKDRAGLINEPDAEVKLHRVHSDACRCRQATVIGCPGDQVRWEYIPKADRKDEAFDLFDERLSVRDVAESLKVSKSVAGRWRIEWQGKKAERVKAKAAKTTCEGVDQQKEFTLN
jgi:hypothetical protein